MKLNKTLLLVLVVFLVVSTLPIVTADDCGFFCKVGELLWGSSENRAGKSWFDRDNIVGMAAGRRTVSENGIKFIAVREGFNPMPYPDAGGCSIGYGHLISTQSCDSIDLETFSGGITQDKAMELLREDARKAVNAVNRHIDVDVHLNQNQVDALVSFTYNVGPDGLLISQVRGNVNSNNFDAVAEALTHFTSSGGVHLDGLRDRRRLEGELFNKPVEDTGESAPEAVENPGESEDDTICGGEASVCEPPEEIDEDNQLSASELLERISQFESGESDPEGRASELLKILRRPLPEGGLSDEQKEKALRIIEESDFSEDQKELARQMIKGTVTEPKLELSLTESDDPSLGSEKLDELEQSIASLLGITSKGLTDEQNQKLGGLFPISSRGPQPPQEEAESPKQILIKYLAGGNDAPNEEKARVALDQLAKVDRTQIDRYSEEVIKKVIRDILTNNLQPQQVGARLAQHNRPSSSDSSSDQSSQDGEEESHPLDVFQRYVNGDESLSDDVLRAAFKKQYGLSDAIIEYSGTEAIKRVISEIVSGVTKREDVTTRLGVLKRTSTLVKDRKHLVNLAKLNSIEINSEMTESQLDDKISARNSAMNKLREKATDFTDEEKAELVEMGVAEQEEDKPDTFKLRTGNNPLPTGETVHVDEDGTFQSVEPQRYNRHNLDGDGNIVTVNGEWSGELPEDAEWDHNREVWKYKGMTITSKGEVLGLDRNIEDLDTVLPEGIDDAGVVCDGSNCHLYNSKKLNAWEIEKDEKTGRSKIIGVDWKHTGTWMERWQRPTEDDSEDLKEFKKYFSGNTKFSKSMTKAITILNSATRWRGINSLVMGSESWYKNYVSVMEEAFAKALAVENVAREACQYQQQSRDKRDGQNAVFIVTAPQVYQFVGSIQAEKNTRKTYLTCTQDENYDYTICPEGLECKEGICYEKNDPVLSFQYKLSWGVLAPQDVRKTPYIDENGKSVKFNVLLTNGDDCSSTGKYLYNRPRSKDKEVIELSNGGSDKDTIVDYSQKNYGTACICFSDKYLSQDRTGNKVHQICAKIANVEQEEVTYDMETPDTVTTTSSSSTVERTDIW